MTFYTYMMRTHKTRITNEGDLARDMERDKEHFPRNRSCKFDGWHRIILDYLVDNAACDECLEVFEKCWEEYVRCEKSRLNKNSSTL